MATQQLHNILTDFSHALTISDEIIKKGNEYMQKIFLTLQNQSRYKLDRCRLLGGVSKKTSIILKFDYDCVIYVNDEDPPFENLLDEWDTILTLDANKITGERKITKHSIQFTMDGFDFDILPAPNYAGSNQDTKQQASIIWKKISNEQDVREGRNLSSLYSSGLSELALEFMRMQSGFIHDLCRLAKYWNGTVLFEQYVSGRSSIVEYLAVKAGQEEEYAAVNNTRSMLRAFRRFLNRLVNCDQISIIFSNFYHRDSVPIPNKPYLIDPTNPYNNLFGNIPPDFLPTMAKSSKETLQRLDRCEISFPVGLEILFDPQPDLRSLFPSNINTNSISTIISCNQNCNEKSKRLIVRRNTFDSNTLDKMKDLMNHTLKYLVTVASTKSEDDIAKNSIQTTEQFLNRSLYKENRQWISADKNHGDCDITFILPLNTAKNDAVYISMTN
jgi:hypothetical protein